MKDRSLTTGLARRSSAARVRSAGLVMAALAALLLASTSLSASAQGAASAPGGMGMPGGGGMRGWHMERGNTPGWSMMSRAERDEHRQKMMSMQNRGECMAYMEQHHAKMAERAKERGRAVPAMPRKNACERLKP
jgi:hypothetical protein